MKSDQAPLRKPTSLETIDAKPEYQPIYPWSIKPYTVRGKHYVPLKSAQDYKATGIASWYGRKFHGHKTANGEVYDMFAMTAAHKTLPIPSFVRVTNLDSQKSIIVRVNDRGPFHDNRVIDLSYSAADARGMLNTGTANVDLEVIKVGKNQTWPPAPAPTPQPTSVQTPEQEQEQDNVPIEKQLFVQVLAGTDGDKVSKTARQLFAFFNHASATVKQNGLFKLRLGPLKDKQQAQELISALKNKGYPSAYMLYSEPTLPHN
ncbi:MAG: septal ring lytic transglycosylase RlpA family protein [Psychrosphaera sp.]|nr:septal ring lytic transglycosylase RlpA family protein [Psychrosphaera sp.]